MVVSTGDRIPDVAVTLATSDGPQKTRTSDVFGAGKVALFSVPGAFTPTCSARHLPGFVDQAEAIKAKGVDRIVCMSVNDAFVMRAWGEAHGAMGKVDMLADGNGDFTRALGLAFDASGFGMGERSQRFSAIVENGVIQQLNVEEPGAFEASSAERILSQLD